MIDGSCASNSTSTTTDPPGRTSSGNRTRATERSSTLPSSGLTNSSVGSRSVPSARAIRVIVVQPQVMSSPLRPKRRLRRPSSPMRVVLSLAKALM
jgi:hypothetical protein